jgi:molybdopterin/thiamine biosynthesis adenylyltransferase
VNAPTLTDALPTFKKVRPASRTFPTEKAADLAGARVLVLGCGSVGGSAAWCLASAGVTGLELADRDRMETANLRRHVCGESDCGRPKGEAVAGFLRARFPTATTTPHHFCFLERPELLRDLIEPVCPR